MQHLLQHEYSVIDATRNLAEHVNGTAEHMSVADLEEIAIWLRWRINEGWQAQLEGGQARTQHYDSLVRALAGEALDLYDIWAQENGLRDP
jgi:hypothetical protein